MAADLGVAGTFAGGTATGAVINRIGVNTGLASFNDGTGVFIRDNAADLRLRVNGTTYDISLGRKDEPITTSTKLSDLNNGAGVRINTNDADDFTVVTSTGVSVGVNLGAIVVDGVHAFFAASFIPGCTCLFAAALITCASAIHVMFFSSTSATQTLNPTSMIWFRPGRSRYAFCPNSSRCFLPAFFAPIVFTRKPCAVNVAWFDLNFWMLVAFFGEPL